MSKSSIIIEDVPERITTSPGAMLRAEFLEPLGLSANALALALRVPANRITAILSGSRAISADTALRLGRYFGTSARFWLNLQQLHDLTKVHRESAARIEQDVLPRDTACAA